MTANKMIEYPGRKMFHRDPITACFVPKCKNRVLTSPTKHFFRVPDRNKEAWCVAVGKKNVPLGALYICEDHINIEEDLLNYDQWRSNNAYGKMKLSVPKLRNITSYVGAGAEQISSSILPLDVLKENRSTICQPKNQNELVQETPKTVEQSIVTTFPLIELERPCHINNINQFNTEDVSEDLLPPALGSTTNNLETLTDLQLKKELVGRTFMLNLIKQKPNTYIGVPKECYWIVEYLAKECNVYSLHIIIILYIIKSNDTFEKICDFFDISSDTLWHIYYEILPALKTFCKQFLFWPKAKDIKRNLPLVFRTSTNYANVQLIIDCFEIEIEKPNKPIEQSLTWSQHKSCYTIKYLISATPDGLINFVSVGYGGSISDIKIVEQSGFLDRVPEYCTVLAARGFKHLESHLHSRNIKVLQLPNVSKDFRISKPESVESKMFGSIREHIEKVFGRVTLYRFLKPHSVVDNKLVKSLDNVVIIACGLVNLQSAIP